jgi:hypothetical protein
MALAGKPYGPNASLKRRTVAAEIGSLPLRTALTLDRSRGIAVLGDTPGRGVVEREVRGDRDGAAGVALLRAISRIQRSGRRTAAGS